METRKVLWALGFYVGIGAAIGLALYHPFELIMTAPLAVGTLCLGLYCIFKYLKG